MAMILPQVHMPAIATSMMASIYGAVRTWDDSLTLTDLFGLSGHAFILNIERTLCPSGPTAWDWGAILFPLRQMYSMRRLCATCDMRSPEEARELIWQRSMESLDAGHPVVLWDAILPEFYLASGYDDATSEYVLQGPAADRLAGRAGADQLGLRSGQVWALFPFPAEKPDRFAARDLALRGAITWHRWANDRDGQWFFGAEAWDIWIAAMVEEEMAHDSQALSLNHFVYAECRRHAATFLAAQGAEFAPAAEAYHQVASALEVLTERWPFPAPVPDVAVRRDLANYLAKARDAENTAIAELEALLQENCLAPVGGA